MLLLRNIIIFCSMLFSIVLCYSQTTFNYDGIAPHPRLLLKAGEENSLKETIQLNPELKNIHDYILQRSDKILEEDVVVYEKRGKRLLRVSREALTRIFYLSYSYRMTGNVEYLNRAENELNAVCTFEDWNPSHFLDVGEMTMAVAIGYDWLYSELEESTKENIRKTILSHAFKASEVKRHGRFLRLENNWNQVCNAGLVYGALAIFDEYPEESIKIIERALKSNPLSMASYAPDGNYPEGPGYWGYGTSFEVMMIAALESALKSDGGLSEFPGFLESARYMLFVNGPIGLRFNYSDCGGRQQLNIPIFWFARKTGDNNLLYEEKKLLQKRISYGNVEESRLLPAMLVFANGLHLSKIKPPAQNLWAGHGATPVVLVRTDWESENSEYLGVKGGCAMTSHAHLDAGSFVYDSKGLRWAMDFGLQSYITLESKGVDLWNKAQDSQRWEVFRYNNKQHNTLTINDKNHDVEGKAYLVETYDTETQKGGQFDLTEVFVGEVESVVRKVSLKSLSGKFVPPDSYLEIEDEIVTLDREAKVRWSMVTPAKARIISPNRIELSQGGKKKRLEVTSEIPVKMQTWQSEDPGTGYDAKNPGTIIVGFESMVPVGKKVSFRVTVKDN